MTIFKSLKSLKEEDHRRALYATLIFIMMNILFFLLVSMEEPDPPLQEVVIPIELEDIMIPEEILESVDAGGGGSEGGPSPVNQQVENSAAQNETQQEESVNIHAGNENQHNPGVNNEPQPDQSLGFNGESGSQNGQDGEDGFGGSDGVNAGPGNGPNGDGTYNPNRKVVTPPTFNANVQEVGKIALDIWVDANGKVVQVRYKESKSTSGSEYLISLATRAANTMQYDKKPGAQKEYVGYQIFEFKKV